MIFVSETGFLHGLGLDVMYDWKHGFAIWEWLWTSDMIPEALGHCEAHQITARICIAY